MSTRARRFLSDDEVGDDGGDARQHHDDDDGDDGSYDAGQGQSGVVWFTKRDVRRQLAELGYFNVPDTILEEFTQDLVQLAVSHQVENTHEHPKSSVPVDMQRRDRAPHHQRRQRGRATFGQDDEKDDHRDSDTASVRSTASSYRVRKSAFVPHHKDQHRGNQHHASPRAKEPSAATNTNGSLRGEWGKVNEAHPGTDRAVDDALHQSYSRVSGVPTRALEYAERLPRKIKTAKARMYHLSDQLDNVEAHDHTHSSRSFHSTSTGHTYTMQDTRANLPTDTNSSRIRSKTRTTGMYAPPVCLNGSHSTEDDDEDDAAELDADESYMADLTQYSLTELQRMLDEEEHDGFLDDDLPHVREVEEVAEQAKRLAVIPRRQEKLKVKKTDVVRKGEKYRDSWAKHKVPGEVRHEKLRWDVRKQLAAEKEEPFSRPRNKPLRTNNYVVPTAKTRRPLRWAVRVHLNTLQ